MELDLNLLRVMVCLDDTRSVTAAAERLGMGQPSVSTALGRLRRAFDDPMFVRTTQGMQPTPRAQAALGPARQALQLVDEQVLQSPTFEPSRSDRVFTLASSDIGEMVFLPRLLAHLEHAAPSVVVRMVSLPHQEMPAAMESGAVDLALGYFPDLKGNNSFQQRLFSHGFVCAVRTGHPIRAARMTLRQFTQARHVVVRSEGRSQEVLERFLARQRIERRVALHTPHFMTVPVIVSQSDLVATLPIALANAFAALASIRLVEPPFDPPRYDLRQHWHRRLNDDPANRWLRGMVAQLFRS